MKAPLLGSSAIVCNPAFVLSLLAAPARRHSSSLRRAHRARSLCLCFRFGQSVQRAQRGYVCHVPTIASCDTCRSVIVRACWHRLRHKRSLALQCYDRLRVQSWLRERTSRPMCPSLTMRSSGPARTNLPARSNVAAAQAA